MSQAFRTKRTISFREADPAQIMFFGNIFGLAHDAFEQFLVAAGFTWKEWFHNQDFLIPIRHTEADFLAPFSPGETYDITVTVASFGATSFKMKYVFSQNDRTHSIVTMVHAVLDKVSRTKTALPFSLKARFAQYLENE